MNTNSNYVITAVDDLTMFNKKNELLFVLDELQNVSLSNNEETTDVTGQNGRKLSTLKQNKNVQITGSNGLISAGMISAQTGGTYEEVPSYTVDWNESVTLDAETVAAPKVVIQIAHKAVGLPGMEILTIARETLGGSVDTINQLHQVLADPQVGEFTYDPITLEITFAEGEDFEQGDIIRIYYRRNVPVAHVNNPSDTFSQQGRAIINCTVKDLCDNVYHGQISIPRADFTGNFTLDIGSEQAIHNFELNALTSVSLCDRASLGQKGIYWDFILMQDDVEDAE